MNVGGEPRMRKRGPQNIYDDPAFFAGYKNLRQNDTGLNGILEIPAIRRLLPDLHGAVVLDLGCGFGDFARYASESGARFVTAVDVSVKMLEQAKQLTTHSNISYLHCAIEDYAPEPQSFDLVVSSMTFHYVADIQAVFRRLFVALQPGGNCVFRRTSCLYSTSRRLESRCKRAKRLLAGRSLSGGRGENDKVVCGQCHQISPYRGDIRKHSA
jgi:ubiquinone/menaquinone biosynthesis C-methylase UbiE